MEKDCKCHSEQSEESSMVLILLVLLKIPPAGRKNNNVDSTIFLPGWNKPPKAG
jgi:hypothetical protein